MPEETGPDPTHAAATPPDPIAALRRALHLMPDDNGLRLHLAETLATLGHTHEAIAECARVLQREPGNVHAQQLMNTALAGPASATEIPPAPETPAIPSANPTSSPGVDFDWTAAESQVGDLAQPMFVDESGAATPDTPAWDVERAGITLDDVGGLTEVKERLQAAFLAPLRNPQLRQLYGKSLKGGLLLYGPPGCGKTFIARAVAGEMGASFISIGLTDVLDMWIGTSERNIHELFQLARRNAPVVLFIDEVDALGQKRSATVSSGMRGTVNQLLAELDGVDNANEGVFVLAATNQPWDVDPALRRPGRLDRTLLVLPPDEPAREAILRHHLKDRPVEGIDLKRLAASSEGYSGADLAHVADTAAERALLDGVRTGNARMIGMDDLLWALSTVRPSTRGWFDVARNVVTYSDTDGSYSDLKAWMKAHKLL